MGGLVIKKAFILGNQIPAFHALIARIYTMFFLATPHQGAKIAQTLSRVLALAPGSRPFVQDLFPQSPVLQSINDEFPRYGSGLKLYSYYETKPMNYGIGNGLIIPKHAAVMNAPNERKTPLDADHRNVGMYANPKDPSYVSVRNALVTVIEGRRHVKKSSQYVSDRDAQAKLSDFLGIFDAPEDDIMTQDTSRIAGSCEWIFRKPSFVSWRQGLESRFFWLRGRPGAGKSVLVGHIVNNLRTAAEDCCFFFFKNGDSFKSSANAFLRSMAWQMSKLHRGVHDRMTELLSAETALDLVDYNAVWRRMYASGILKVKLDKPQYWVVDSLDECRSSSSLMSLLVRAQQYWPVFILVTSRDPYESHVSTTIPECDIHSETITDEDTNQDIAIFLNSNIDLLPLARLSATWGTRTDLVNHIVKGAMGCFLWAYLIFQELRQVHTAVEIKEVLESTPTDMGQLYWKILSDMSKAKFSKELTQALLTWATYSLRSLTTDEVRVCIEMDINDTIDDVEKSISTCCGNLVYVGKAQRMQLIHVTAKQFLMRKDLDSEFVVDRAEGHRRSAMVCIKYLMKNSQRQSKSRPQQPHRRASSSVTHVDGTILRDYASNSLFTHLFHVRSTDDEIFKSLARFLKTPGILHWIEDIVNSGNLQAIFHAGRTIRNLIDRRGKHSPPLSLPLTTLNKDLSVLSRWATDLIYLSSRFSRWLRLCPSCIHHLIHPFCPLHSIIRTQFSNPFRGITAKGLSDTGCDECITTITYEADSKPTTIASGTGYFAVGFMSGRIKVYGGDVCQELRILAHGEPVWGLVFSDSVPLETKSKMVATAGAKFVRIWDVETGAQLHRLSMQSSSCLALRFTDKNKILHAVTKRNQVYEWEVENGYVLDDPADWTRDLDGGGGLEFRLARLRWHALDLLTTSFASLTKVRISFYGTI